MKPKYYSAKRRHAMSLGEEFTSLEIFERDNWMCCLCGKKIDKRLRLPNWQAATLEHLKPLCVFEDVSLWHTRANVSVAHAKCNWDKADKVLPETQ